MIITIVNYTDRIHWRWSSMNGESVLTKQHNGMTEGFGHTLGPWAIGFPKTSWTDIALEEEANP